MRSAAIFVLLLSLTEAARGQAPNAISPYILVLEEAVPGTKEPDVKRHGGTVVKKYNAMQHIRLPRAAAQALCAEEGVAYLQRIWEGEVIAPSEPPPCAPPRRVSTNAAETNLTWTTGEYHYDPSGNIKDIGTDQFAYDTGGRLIQATVAGTTEQYSYDAFGNLTAKGQPGEVVTIGVDASTNRLSGVPHDVAGNVTARGLRTYTYDGAGMLVVAEEAGSDPVRYIYTADDERLATVRPNRCEIKIRDFSGKVLREYWAGYLQPLEPWAWQEDYVHAGGQLIAAQREERVGGKRHFHLDHLGSVRMMTNDSRLRVERHDYMPFGKEHAVTAQDMKEPGYSPESLKFTGHERDTIWRNYAHEDDLDYMHARYYSASWGRFLSVDPLLDLKQATRNPQGWNRYTYVSNNPVRFADPTGKYQCEGSRNDCAALRTAYNDLRSAASSLPRGAERNRVNRVLSFLGRPGQANGVTVTVGSGTISGAAGGASTTTHTASVGPTGYTTQLGSNFANLSSTLPGGRSGSAFGPELAAALAHEAQHGIDQRRAGGMPTTAAAVRSSETNAATTQSNVYRGLNFESSWETWTRANGYDPVAIQRQVERSVQDWCNAPGANCQ